MVQYKTTFYLVAAVYIISSYPKPSQALSTIDWGQCALAARNASVANPQGDFLRGWNGRQTNDLSKAQGVSYEWCTANCPKGSKVISWNTFSLQFSSWLLPWIALTSQLPFETRSQWRNIQSLVLAIGCPFLVIYSLAATVFNAGIINTVFRKLKQDAGRLRRPLQAKLIDAARILMLETQSIPFRVVNGPHREFAQLILNPTNWPWWTLITKEILKTKRLWTQSLIVQLGIAFTAHILTIISYFRTPADDVTTSVGLAINSLWVWLIPITFGWVKIGTQTSARSIKTALESITVPVISGKSITGNSVGFRDRSQYNDPKYRRWVAPPPSFGDHRARSRMRHVEDSDSGIPLLSAPPADNDSQDLEAQNYRNREELAHPCLLFLGFPVAGDDSEPGPIFNYARVWSHMTTVCLVQEALNNLVNKPRWTGENQDAPYNEDQLYARLYASFNEDLAQMSTYISSGRVDHPTLPVHSQPFEGVRSTSLKAAGVAIFLGWGTIGSGLLIAYKTPTTGLSCDSGAYLIYGCAAFSSFLLLTLGSYLSHLILSQTETYPEISSATRIDIPVFSHHIAIHIPLSLLTPVTISLRLSAKCLAIFNATFLLLTNILQFTNLYDNCWCSAAVMSRGVKGGWVVLFANDQQIVDASRAAWIAGVFMSFIVAGVVLGGIWVLSWEEKGVS